MQKNRSTNRRPPQSMQSLQEEFNAEKFNFRQIDATKELLFNIRNTEETRTGVDQLMINVSPINFGHSLITPQVDHCLPQVLTEYSIRVGLELMFLSSSPDLRIAFNSLCAYASVNHLHFHLIYLETPLYIQKVQLEGCGSIYLLPSSLYPAPAFVFLLKDNTDIQLISRRVYLLVSWLNQQNIAHNLIMIRGRTDSGEGENEYIRVVVWARENVVGAKAAEEFVTAVCELSGQILVFQENFFETITEEDIVAAHTITVQPVFNRIKEKVEEMFRTPV